MVIVGGRANVVRYILETPELECLINQPDVIGNTPLHLATIERKTWIMYYLMWDGRVHQSSMNKCGQAAFDIDRSIKESSIASPRDKMKKMRDEIREKLIQEAPECNAPDSIQVPLDAEFGIMGEKLGRRGRSIHGVGVFPRMETSSSSTPSMASSSELSAIYD
ncbi:unnamed protein product [Prunus brigantina]